MYPANETQPPVGRVKANNAWADVVERDSYLKQWSCKRRIMNICRRNQKLEREARTPTNHRMDTEAPQKRSRMMCRSVTISSVGIGPTPSENRSTIYDGLICAKLTWSADEPPACFQA